MAKKRAKTTKDKQSAAAGAAAVAPKPEETPSDSSTLSAVAARVSKTTNVNPLTPTASTTMDSDDDFMSDGGSSHDVYDDEVYDDDTQDSDASIEGESKIVYTCRRVVIR